MKTTLVIAAIALFTNGCTSGPKQISHDNVVGNEAQKITSREGHPLSAQFSELESTGTLKVMAPKPIKKVVEPKLDPTNSLHGTTTPQEVSVNFAVNATSLSSDQVSQIDQFLQQNVGGDFSDRVFEVTGYADKTGDSTYNMELSTKRAGYVRNLLVKKGVSPENIKTIGAGEMETESLSDARAVTIFSRQ